MCLQLQSSCTIRAHWLLPLSVSASRTLVALCMQTSQRTYPVGTHNARLICKGLATGRASSHASNWYVSARTDTSLQVIPHIIKEAGLCTGRLQCPVRADDVDVIICMRRVLSSQRAESSSCAAAGSSLRGPWAQRSVPRFARLERNGGIQTLLSCSASPLSFIPCMWDMPFTACSLQANLDINLYRKDLPPDLQASLPAAEPVRSWDYKIRLTRSILDVQHAIFSKAPGTSARTEQVGVKTSPAASSYKRSQLGC